MISCSKAAFEPATAKTNTLPARATISTWCALSGMGRSTTYKALGRRDLQAIKLGTRTPIDVAHGLAWLATLPAASVRLHGASRRKQAV